MGNSTTVAWEDPAPGSPSRYTDWVAVLSPLIRRPERWARVAEKQSADTARSTARNLRNRAVIIPPGSWEFASRTVRKDGKVRYFVYARYLGDKT